MLLAIKERGNLQPVSVAIITSLVVVLLIVGTMGTRSTSSNNSGRLKRSSELSKEEQRKRRAASTYALYKQIDDDFISSHYAPKTKGYTDNNNNVLSTSTGKTIVMHKGGFPMMKAGEEGALAEWNRGGGVGLHGAKEDVLTLRRQRAERKSGASESAGQQLAEALSKAQLPKSKGAIGGIGNIHEAGEHDRPDAPVELGEH